MDRTLRRLDLLEKKLRAARYLLDESEREFDDLRGLLAERVGSDRQQPPEAEHGSAPGGVDSAGHEREDPGRNGQRAPGPGDPPEIEQMALARIWEKEGSS